MQNTRQRNRAIVLEMAHARTRKVYEPVGPDEATTDALRQEPTGPALRQTATLRDQEQIDALHEVLAARWVRGGE